ncbi:response regulator transcription factor [Azohydromonas australica]|uniref:response regulator transcription factor n=1 Tax=Azohydromonas australica TaxID=364039 RepID=UPI00040F4C14|nr:response regulator [Azohydromonas australica]
MQRSSLNLYVVDDDEAVRRSLLLMLMSTGFAVQGFESGEAFLDAVDMRRSGVLVLDLRLGGLSGLEVFARLKATHSPLVVLFLSGHGDIPTALNAVRRGAYDWVVKPDSEALLAKLPGALEEAAGRAEALVLWESLTPREREVAVHVARGTPNKEIARLLQPPCSPRSVETHRAHLFAKLGMSNDNVLGRWLERHAWLVDAPLAADPMAGSP